MNERTPCEEEEAAEPWTSPHTRIASSTPARNLAFLASFAEVWKFLRTPSSKPTSADGWIQPLWPGLVDVQEGMDGTFRSAQLPGSRPDQRFHRTHARTHACTHMSLEP